ncbi:hypothetical protein ACFX2J_009847 [Malus domestica]
MAEWEDHGVGGRAPEAKSCHEKLFIHYNLNGRELDGVVNTKSFPLLTEEFFHSNDTCYPIRIGRMPGSLGFFLTPLRPIKSLQQICQTVFFEQVGDR